MSFKIQLDHYVGNIDNSEHLKLESHTKNNLSAVV